MSEDLIKINAELEERQRELEAAKCAAENVLEDLRVEKEKLASIRARDEAVLANIGDALVVIGEDGKVVLVNRMFEMLTGLKEGDVRGKCLCCTLPMLDERGDPIPKEERPSCRTIEEKRPTVIESTAYYRRADGTLFPVALTTSTFFVGDGFAGVVEVFRDITKETEIDRAKSEFISLASHQMRTPLTAINWYTEMLMDGDGGKLAPKQEDYFKEILSASRQMNEIIKSFLYILHLDTGALAIRPAPLDPVDLMRTVVKESQVDIERRRLRVVEEYQEALPSLEADESLVRVVLQNLITNAVKYTLEGKDITISLHCEKQGGVVAGKTVPAESLLVSVHSAGVCIPKCDGDKIFTKFFRTDGAKKWDPNGIGLGLYMSKKVTDISGGTIWFDSSEEKGTTFYVLLPLVCPRRGIL